LSEERIVRHLRYCAKVAILIILNLAAVVAGLKLYDSYVLGSNSDPHGSLTKLPGADLNSAQKTARTLELFPYEGWHMQVNVRDGEFRLGSMGFAIDFDILSPPAKQSNEYRIILIGGSGAQGWGASSTETTMARVLETLLNKRADGHTYRVINLAMGSSVTYQNFISLNRWAHPLQPDLILSYSGVNDCVVPLVHDQLRDAYLYFNELNGMVIAARASEVPPQLSWLYWLFPNLMTNTSLGYGIKYALYPQFFIERGEESFDHAYGRRYNDPNTFMDEVVSPEYIHAMQSIRRDFDWIPMLIVWQAMSPDEMRVPFGQFRRDLYDRMYQQAAEHLSGPGWYTANFNAFNEKSPRDGVAVHLADRGQRILAEYIAKKLACVFAAAPPTCLAD
jgi:hypothetical protein